MTDVSVNDGMWHHIVVTWQSRGGTWKVYVNGELDDHGAGLAEGTMIEGQRWCTCSYKIIQTYSHSNRAVESRPFPSINVPSPLAKCETLVGTLRGRCILLLSANKP